MMFKLNNRLQVKQETLQESVIYYIDNFYLHPKEVEEYLFDKDTPLHKIEQKPSYNNIHFEDRRLIKEDERLHSVVDFLSQICNQKPCFSLCDFNLKITIVFGIYFVLD